MPILKYRFAAPTAPASARVPSASRIKKIRINPTRTIMITPGMKITNPGWKTNDIFHRQSFRADDGAETAVQAGGTASRPAEKPA